MYVCKTKCTFVCIYVCLCVCLYACVHIFIYVCMYACLYIYMYVYMYVCMYVCMHVRMYVQLKYIYILILQKYELHDANIYEHMGSLRLSCVCLCVSGKSPMLTCGPHRRSVFGLRKRYEPVCCIACVCVCVLCVYARVCEGV